MYRANGAAIKEEHDSALVWVGWTEVDSVFTVILIGIACISGDVRYCETAERMQVLLQCKVARFLIVVPKFVGSERSSRTPPWIECLDSAACWDYHARAISMLVCVTPERRRKACSCARCALAVVKYAVRVLHSVLMMMSVRSSNA